MTAARLTDLGPAQLPAVPRTSLAARSAATSAPSASPVAAPQAGVFCFSIQAEADPGALPRVLELIAKRGLVPRRWVSDRFGPGGRELAIDLQVEGLTRSVADHIARCLRQVPCVTLVLTSEKLTA